MLCVFSSWVELRFRREIQESPPHEMVLSTQALYTKTLVCPVNLLLSVNQ